MAEIELTLTISQILDLEAEINGIYSLDKKTRLLEGLLAQNLSFLTKHTLLDFLESLNAQKSVIDKVIDEIVIKYGTKNSDGSVVMNKYIIEDNTLVDPDAPKKINPKFLEFEQDYSELMKKEKSIKVPQIKISELSNIVTKEVYPVFSKYLVIKE